MTKPWPPPTNKYRRKQPVPVKPKIKPRVKSGSRWTIKLVYTESDGTDVFDVICNFFPVMTGVDLEDAEYVVRSRKARSDTVFMDRDGQRTDVSKDF